MTTATQSFASAPEYRDNIVVVILENLLTTAEPSLLNSGKKSFVLDERTELQDVMRQDLVTAVEELTGRGVLAFMSANQIDPDMGCEVFVLDGPVIAEPAAPPTPITLGDPSPFAQGVRRAQVETCASPDHRQREEPNGA